MTFVYSVCNLSRTMEYSPILVIDLRGGVLGLISPPRLESRRAILSPETLALSRWRTPPSGPIARGGNIAQGLLGWIGQRLRATSFEKIVSKASYMGNGVGENSVRPSIGPDLFIHFSVHTDVLSCYQRGVKGRMISVYLTLPSLPARIRYSHENVYYCELLTDELGRGAGGVSGPLAALICDLRELWQGVDYRNTSLHSAGRNVRAAVVYQVGDTPSMGPVLIRQNKGVRAHPLPT